MESQISDMYMNWRLQLIDYWEKSGAINEEQAKAMRLAVFQDYDLLSEGVLGRMTNIKNGIATIVANITSILATMGPTHGSSQRINVIVDTPAYAEGTSWHPGGPAWVGENGPEMLNLPTGSSVTPMGKLGATYVIHNHFGPGSVRTDRDIMRMAEEQDKALRLRGMSRTVA
jgi:hypothetical protein